MLEKWLNKLRGRPESSPLDRHDEQRGGLQSEEYRKADPRDVVEEDGVMSAPGGAPQDDDDATARRP